MIDIQSIKQRFGIIGNDPNLNRAIEVAVQVAATDLTVFINGESGTGKDVFPQIIHQNSVRKHGPYFAINCGVSLAMRRSSFIFSTTMMMVRPIFWASSANSMKLSSL